jgi:hypothetical protein
MNAVVAHVQNEFWSVRQRFPFIIVCGEIDALQLKIKVVLEEGKQAHLE